MEINNEKYVRRLLEFQLSEEESARSLIQFVSRWNLKVMIYGTRRTVWWLTALFLLLGLKAAEITHTHALHLHARLCGWWKISSPFNVSVGAFLDFGGWNLTEASCFWPFQFFSHLKVWILSCQRMFSPRRSKVENSAELFVRFCWRRFCSTCWAREQRWSPNGPGWFLIVSLPGGFYRFLVFFLQPGSFSRLK